MSFYSQLAATAAKLIAEKGQDVTLVTELKGAYNPSSGVSDAGTTASTAKAVITDYPFKAIDGTLIRSGDKQALLSGELDPNDCTAVVIGGARHEIVSVRPVAPGGTPVICKVQVRRGGG